MLNRVVLYPQGLSVPGIFTSFQDLLNNYLLLGTFVKVLNNNDVKESGGTGSNTRTHEGGSECRAST